MLFFRRAINNEKTKTPKTTHLAGEGRTGSFFLLRLDDFSTSFDFLSFFLPDEFDVFEDDEFDGFGFVKFPEFEEFAEFAFGAIEEGGVGLRGNGGMCGVV